MVVYLLIMKVQVLSLDNHYAIRIMYTAARTCYSKESPIKIFYESASKPVEDMQKVIAKALDAGHLSIAEHYQFNILIEGVSRALSHQLVRHRHCTFSQQSQRYCKLDNHNCFDYVEPQSIAKNIILRDKFRQEMYSLSELYNILIENGIEPEDARSILPNACTTNLVLTCNLHELMHICNERLCTCAQLEIRKLFNEIANQAIKDIPFMKTYFVPKCEKLGYCNESEKRSCKRKQLKENIIYKSQEI